ncbi:MAG: MBOAT family protein [Bacteroidetes bacterium]|nr:MAG: MBOAT family protein [Bacteroidota bacterium]MBL1144032.1 MBOAT family protein [Bacteroidota bacterium]NOG56832.1 MBOAT family protein [Bacteroidota bacterium]
MLFNSLQFLCFLPIVVMLYFSLAHRYRWLLLLVASYYFYGSWKVEYLLLIVLSTIVDYYVAIKMHEQTTKGAKKSWLIASVLINLGVLFWFKYYGFFSDSINSVLSTYTDSQLPLYQFLLPVGISFYTFQSMSYTIDVYRNERLPERHLGVFALYVSFFPQLVAGPIERSTSLLPQFFIKHDINYLRIVSGLKQIVRGFFKKVVVADRLSIYVDTIYNNYENHTGVTLLLATIFFAFQIYCDFSGYSDIAIGSARLMGFELMENFKRPYFSKGIREFWSRWHISLSTWFRDYLYIPLGGNRVVKWRVYYNLMLVFVVSGFWHGANWTFIVWGVLHGIYIVIETMINNPKTFKRSNKLTQAAKISFTFILVCFAWIFFRANNIEEAFEIIKRILSFKGSIYLGGQSNLIYSVITLTILILVEFKQELTKKGTIHRSPYFTFFKYLVIVIVIMLLGVFDEGQFIYFQF